MQVAERSEIHGCAVRQRDSSVRTAVVSAAHRTTPPASWYHFAMNELPQKVRPGVRMVVVDAEHAGQRIDNFLAYQLKGVPKSHIYRVLRKGEVRVNSSRARPEYRLQAGDKVRIPPVRQSEPGPAPVAGPALLARLEAAIVHEDSQLLVLNKPAGVAVHGGSGLSYGVIEALRVLRPGAQLELVHRLDRDTSGCLMIAKRRSVLRGLHELLRQGAVDKRYLALLCGRWRGGRRRVSVALRKNVLHGGERMVEVDATGKESLTVFEPIALYEGASLMEVRLATGRTHQIRVHAAHIGHPIAGDEKYGDSEHNRRMRELGLRRLFLHAHSLAFKMPGSECEVRVSAPLGEDLQRVLDRLDDAHG
jgi:23S rRNA pseudouridine955/2504/2580 synthase